MSVLSEWLGQLQVGALPSVYFSESKLQTWAHFADLVEDALKSVRKELSPLLQDLQKGIGARMIGQFMFDSMSTADILNNQDTAQALVDGLEELSKEHSDKPLEFLSDFLLKKSKKSKDHEGNIILTKCDPKETLSLLTKKGDVIEDNSRDTKWSLSHGDLHSEGLAKLEPGQ